MKDILIIIPAYNEAKNISNVIGSLTEFYPEADILVVNDGSNDNTAEIVRSWESVILINLSHNLGIGGAVQTGFKYAVRNNYKFAVQFDGDGQHLAREIPKIIEPIINNVADVIIGSRFLNNSSEWRSTPVRRLGIWIFRITNAILIRKKITDSTSGFRAYNKTALIFLAEFYPTDYPEPEAIIWLGKSGFIIKEVPVKMIGRAEGKSSINFFLAGYYMVKVLLSVFITYLRPVPILRRQNVDPY